MNQPKRETLSSILDEYTPTQALKGRAEGDGLPTKQMIKAGGRAINPEPNSHGMNDGIYEAAARRCWKAMSAAALPTRDGVEGVGPQFDYCCHGVERKDCEQCSRSTPPKPAPDAMRPLYATPPIRGDREAITNAIINHMPILTGLKKAVDAILSLPAQPNLPLGKDILYAILSKHIPQDMIDGIWQELTEALR